MSTDTLDTKNKPVRGPGGRFMSIKHVNGPKPIQNPPPSPVVFYDDLSYYGEIIRRTHKNGQWFFVIEDFFPLVQITDPPMYISMIKNDPPYKELLDSELFEIVDSSVGTERGPIIVGNQKAVLEVVNLFREEKKIFPGPFLQWIETTAKLTLEGQLDRVKYIEKDLN